MFKKIIGPLSFSVFFVLASCKNDQAMKITDDDMKKFEEQKVQASKLPKIEFDKTEHDFGSIQAGEKVSAEFVVKNIGENDLVISDASATCGCTVPDYPKFPLKPGQSAPIKVTFDSNGKSGIQNKTVTLTTNTAIGKETFSIKANVLSQNNGAPISK